MNNSTEYRLFLAVELPPDLRSVLLGLRPGASVSAPPIRWTQEQNLHLTIRFIGNHPGSQLPELLAGLEQAEFAPFELTLEGLGLFNRQQQAILWAGFAHSSPLQRLKNSLDQILKAVCGLSCDKGPYTPHITLARLKKIGEYRHWLNELEKLQIRMQERSLGKFTATTFSLFKSELRPQGPLYTCLRTFPAA